MRPVWGQALSSPGGRSPSLTQEASPCAHRSAGHPALGPLPPLHGCSLRANQPEPLAQRRCNPPRPPTALPARWPPFCPALELLHSRPHPRPSAWSLTLHSAAERVPVTSLGSRLIARGPRVLSSSPGGRFLLSCGSCSVSPAEAAPAPLVTVVLPRWAFASTCSGRAWSRAGLLPLQKPPRGQARLSRQCLCPQHCEQPSRLLRE